MVFSVSGSGARTKEVHWKNADSPILSNFVTPFNSHSAVHPAKAESSMIRKAGEASTRIKPVHWLKAEKDIF